MRPDPRIRQTLDQLSSALESAADTAYTGCFTFTSAYLTPCLASLTSCCVSARAPRPPRHRSHRRNPSDYPFGFYDYYAAEYSDSDSDTGGGGFLGWGTGELDRLLAGSGAAPTPRRETMHYGTLGGGPSRRATHDPDAADPTVIPSTNMFGFLSAFGVRARAMRYKPSAANLQEHPTRRGRRRANTGSSGDSLRSRGDLWPSEDEDDAVVIGDDAFPSSGDDESARRLRAKDGEAAVGLSASPEPYMTERGGGAPFAMRVPRREKAAEGEEDATPRPGVMSRTPTMESQRSRMVSPPPPMSRTPTMDSRRSRMVSPPPPMSRTPTMDSRRSRMVSPPPPQMQRTNTAGTSRVASPPPPPLQTSLQTPFVRYDDGEERDYEDDDEDDV
ncbi:hypothetical protein EDC01DRAFT_649799 [Geopyxis carbonaria]|nr:hypothetical protein EDC01DRAFT_649799 [Geopyxis carbonaria]